MIMNKEDKELQKHLIDEMMKVYKTNPDVMIYMEALMKKYEEKEQEIDRLNNIIDELEKDINNQLMMTRVLDEYNEGYFDATLHYYNKLKELKDGNNE